jgi:hypothetical protein
MPRKPNYAFERHERDRAKALKLAEKADAKRRQRERGDAGDDTTATTPVPDEA